MSLSFWKLFWKIKPIFVLRIPILSSAFVLDLHQAGSFLSSPSPEPSHKRTLSTLQRKPPHIELVSLFQTHTEQHQLNPLRISLLKTWILNLIPPGDLTVITHDIFVRFVPDYIINKTVFILLPPPPEYVGQSYFEYSDRWEPLFHSAAV
ncbi:hypothetical protein ATANTOWER_032696 [Ataeniobius toweri]|uniref:Uncharacterized protein n=1 Tax=Ataeniobius toweri TaxID=208326 RepID=A0ABU7AU49_9TELE|nr:hypothetical protein [Ataeniobius toweri]